MIVPSKKPLAIFKIRSTTIIPYRPGPVQCVRSCPHCTDRQDLVPTKESEAIIALKTFKDISPGLSFWNVNYHSVQYHEGQTYLLKHAVENHAPRTIIIVGASNYKDVGMIERVLDKAAILDRQVADVSDPKVNIIDLLSTSKTLVLPLHYETCAGGSPIQMLDYETFKNLLHQIFETANKDRDFNLNIVPTIITKDHNRTSLRREGSVCIQIMEPFSLKDYCRNVIISDKTSHLLQHIYHDISHHSVILPTHLVAFLILYLERQKGPTLDDLIYYVEWFRRSSLEHRIFYGFTGDTPSVIQFALDTLRNIVYLSRDKTYQTRDLEKLIAYGQTVTPMLAIYGCVAQAILEVFNTTSRYEPQDAIPHQIPIKVALEDVRKTAIAYVSEIDDDICFKRPCSTVDACITEALSNMQCQGRFFKLDEPKADLYRGRYWAGEFSDDEFNSGRVEKVWLVLSDKSKRRDRLDLFINAIRQC